MGLGEVCLIVLHWTVSATSIAGDLSRLQVVVIPTSPPSTPTPASPAPLVVIRETSVASDDSSEWAQHLGFEFSPLGLFDITAAHFVWAPFRWLEVFGGPTTDWFSAGVEAGTKLRTTAPNFNIAFRVQGGYQFEGNVNSLTGLFGRKGGDDPTLDHIGFAHASADGCLELGSSSRFISFFGCAGAALFHASNQAEADKFKPTVANYSSRFFLPVLLQSKGLDAITPDIRFGFEMLWSL